jgi:hypothetical protein
MAKDPLEARFVERLQFEVGDAEVAQELSIPRKSRRLDVVCRFGEAPAMFDALRADCSQRMVVFEHESQPLARHAVARAWSSMAWLLWEQLRPPRPGRRPPMLRPEAGERPPLAVIVADEVSDRMHGAVPALRPTGRRGLWSTPELDEGGLYVVNTSEIDPSEGLAWWSWIGLARNAEQERARLTALLGDTNLPIDDRARIQEAVMNGQLSATQVEQETASQRVRREGEERGGVTALLSLVRQIAPDRVEEFGKITDPAELQQAVAKLFRR